MLDPHTEHATHLRNHWYWRPGHRPGRPYYTWHLTFERQHDLHRLVSEYHQALHHVAGLDLVPIPWLHITMQGIGFADRVPEADRDAIIETARRRLAAISTPTLTFHHATIHPEAVVLYPCPAEPVRTIRSELRAAIAQVWGNDNVPESANNYQPHLSIAYVNQNAAPSHIIEILSALILDPTRLTLTAASCIALQGGNHLYRWKEQATAPIGKRSSTEF